MNVFHIIYVYIYNTYHIYDFLNITYYVLKCYILKYTHICIYVYT